MRIIYRIFPCAFFLGSRGAEASSHTYMLLGVARLECEAFEQFGSGVGVGV
jgi:hypothetical protein